MGWAVAQTSSISFRKLSSLVSSASPSKTARDAQQEALLAVWNGARRNHPRSVLLTGEAGLGKSWLMRSLADRLEAERCAHVVVSGAGLLSALLRATKNWLEVERSAAFLSAARRVLPNERWSVVAGDAGEVNVALEIIAAIERVVQRLGGLCLIVEDAHCCEADDLELLRLLHRRALANRSKLFLVLTARPARLHLLEMLTADANLSDGLAPLQIALERLDASGIALLTAEVLRCDDVPPELVTWLFERCEGHPLHAQELLRFLIGSGYLRDIGATQLFTQPPASACPVGLEAVLMARLGAAALEPDLWRALSVLAVLERAVSLDDWGRAATMSAERLEGVSRRALSLGLVRAESALGALRFALTHPLYPPLLRGQLAESELKTRYRAVMPVALDAFECSRWARLGDSPEALPLTRVALKAARSRSAWGEILQLCDAIQHLESDAAQHLESDRTDLQFERGEALFRLGRFADALDVLKPLESAPAAELTCLVLARLGRDREGFAFSSQWLERFDAHTNFRLRYFWACFQARLGDETKSATWIAWLLRTAATPAQTSTALDALDWHSKIYAPHQPMQRLTRNLEGLAAFKTADLPNSISEVNHHIFIAENYVALREFDQALESLQTAQSLMQRTSNIDTLTIYHLHLGLWALESGKPEAAQRSLLKSLALARQMSDPIQTAHALFELTRAEFALGQFDAAAKRLADYELATAALEQRFDGGQLLYQRPFDLEVAALRLQLGLECDTADSRLESALGDDALHAGLIYLLSGQAHEALIALSLPVDAGQREHPTRPLLRGVAHLQRAEFDAAHTQFDRSRHLAKTQRHDALEGQAEIALGFCAALQGHLPEGRRLAQGGAALLEMARCTGFLAQWRRLYPSLADELLSTAPAKPLAPAKPVRFIRTFGAFGVEQHGEVNPWKARKTRELLALLLCAGVSETGPSLPRNALIAALWPEADPAKGESSFRVTLGRLRQSLGDAAGIERDSSGRYALVNAKTDLILFLESCERRDLEGALAWYAGEFLPGMDFAVVDRLRVSLRSRWRNAIMQVILESDLTRGATLLETLLEDNPFDLSALRQLVQHLSNIPDTVRLTATIERFKKRFRDELGFTPPELETWTRAAQKA